MFTRVTRAVCAFGLLIAGSFDASAMLITERFQLREIIFTHPDTLSGGATHSEAGGSTHFELRQQNTPASAGEVITRSYILNNSFRDIIRNISWVGDAHVNVTNVSVDVLNGSGLTEVTAQFESIDGLPGTSVLSWDDGRAHNRLVEDGHYVFRQIGVGGLPFGGVLVDDGFAYTERITFSGNWSSVGTSPGSHLLEAVNARWTIDQNFVFDGVQTVFQAHIDPFFNDGRHGLGLAYSLHAPIPEPATYALLLIGLGIVGCGVRRSKRDPRGLRRNPRRHFRITCNSCR